MEDAVSNSNTSLSTSTTSFNRPNKIGESNIKPWIKDLNLQKDDLYILEWEDRLNDRYIDVANQLLKQHGGNGCWQISLPAQTSFQSVSGDTILILHRGDDHWVCTKEVVYLADILRLTPTESIKEQMR